MAFKDKEQYFRDLQNAGRRMADRIDSAKEKGLTEEQAGALNNVCSLRHELHTSMDEICISDNSGVKKQLVEANIELKRLGLPYMEFIPVYPEDYIDIDTFEEAMQFDEFPNEDDYESSEEYSDAVADYRDQEVDRIHDELNELHNKIEKYLGEIDEKFGTSFCPTGKMRIF